MFPAKKSYQPISTFAGSPSAPKDFDRKNMMRDRGIIYQANGSGRDTYIYNDSGGFNKMKEPRQQFHPGSAALGLPGLDYKKFFNKDKHPYIHSRPI